MDSAGRRGSAWAELSLLLTAFFFGTNFVAVKHVVEEVPPVLFAAVRFTAAGLLLWAVLRLLEPASRLKRADLLPVVGLGLLGITATQTVFTIGVHHTTAANTAVIYSTAPVWGMLLGFALGLERPRVSGVAGVVMCLAGVAAIESGGLRLAGTSLLGDALILLAAVFWGSYTVLSLPLLRRYTPLAVAAYPMLLGGIAAFPLAALDLRLDPSSLDGSVWFAALYSTLFSSAFGFVGWQKGVARVGANRVLVYQYLVALSGVVAGMVVLGEGFGLLQALGAAVILLGVYLARRR
ncbi:multidrug DMT transporter permease [Rubrobacter xylanophilus]|uniref:Multidrug DMT transporter permease n=1 Tax=Rubrobacter xylanophilus TaxID=49319 RepID=A0A510HE06_9ACTN|nr:DMT family transporter [Rubrobacter xylanophilus]BBL78158.1 multidrug DMT transporter permease [Rubrobacter xylanophilus]